MEVHNTPDNTGLDHKKRIKKFKTHKNVNLWLSLFSVWLPC